MKRRRVFLIDDHDAVLELLRRVMSEIDVEVVGTASGGGGVVGQVLEAAPDLVVLDLSMPDQSGFDIVAELRARDAECRFLAFTGVNSMHAIERIAEMRFDGIVSKTSRIQELVDGVKAVLSGKTYACKLFTDLRKEQKGKTDHPSQLLTPREIQVLSLIGKAQSDAQIAAVLGISSTTVQGFRTKLMHKLGMTGTPQLVRFANEHGYAEFGKWSGPQRG